jgi:hypothetical protein
MLFHKHKNLKKTQNIDQLERLDIIEIIQRELTEAESSIQ